MLAVLRADIEKLSLMMGLQQHSYFAGPSGLTEGWHHLPTPGELVTLRGAGRSSHAQRRECELFILQLH